MLRKTLILQLRLFELQTIVQKALGKQILNFSF